MFQRTSNRLVALTSVVLLAAGMTAQPAFAQKSETPPALKPLDKLAAGEDEVKQLVILIAADQSGTVSKEDFLKFMEAEFARLDKEKTGQLDAKALAQSMSSERALKDTK
jgi:hypothetical protein